MLAIIAAIGLWMYFGKAGGDKNAGGAVQVTVTPVARQDVPITVDLVGTVIAYESVAVKSRLDSQIVNVLFKDGDYVKEGQVLFELDDRTVNAQVAQLTAALEKEKANLVNAQLQYTRAQNLVKTKAVSQAQADDAKAAWQAQQAQVNAAVATLENEKILQTYTQIMAPISGRTGTINVTRGNNVKANDTTAMVTINQISPIRVQFAIPQRYYAELRNAMSAGDVKVTAVRQESPDVTTGKLEYLDNAIDASNGTFAARAVFENQDERLWPGMFVNINMDLGVEKNVLTVPSVAIQGDEGSRFVFISDADGKKAIKKAVDIGQNTGDITVIHKGLEDNNRVIIDGILRVTDGGPIQIVDPSEAQPSAGPTSESGT